MKRCCLNSNVVNDVVEGELRRAKQVVALSFCSNLFLNFDTLDFCVGASARRPERFGSWGFRTLQAVCSAPARPV